jgi:Flp pilus assembly protein TadG
LVEFAIVVPLLLLLICGTIDFGLIFGGYQSMENGVASAARVISLDQVTPSSSCTGGPTAATANAVCNVAASLGNLEGLNSNTLAVGICFVAPSATPSCSGTSAPGSSVAQDVEICAQATMQSTTGLTSVFVSGSTVSTTSRQLMEEPQPSGATAFQSYNSTSTSVVYNGVTVPGMTCS